MRTLTNAQVDAALREAVEKTDYTLKFTAMVIAASSMVAKSFCKAAGLKDSGGYITCGFSTNAVADCLAAVMGDRVITSRWPSAVRMTTHLIEEAALIGAAMKA